MLGLIDAALGRKEEALREGRRARGAFAVAKDAIHRPADYRGFGAHRCLGGERALACEQLVVRDRHRTALAMAT